jgi:DNA-directed RNA polymerase specialized sigma24 family protein
MDIYDDLADIAADQEMYLRAVRRAGSRELAEDALQETVRAIAGRKSPEAIENLPGFFYVSLIREIDHQLGRPAAIPVGADIGLISDRAQDRPCPAAAPLPASVEGEATLRLLAETVLHKLEREHARSQLAALVPARSEDPPRYRNAIASAARTIFELLLDGCVTAADWNAILKAAYPQWCDEPGLARAAIDQRLSRARHDVQSLLRSVLSRDELAS